MKFFKSKKLSNDDSSAYADELLVANVAQPEPAVVPKPQPATPPSVSAPIPQAEVPVEPALDQLSYEADLEAEYEQSKLAESAEAVVTDASAPSEELSEPAEPSEPAEATEAVPAGDSDDSGNQSGTQKLTARALKTRLSRLIASLKPKRGKFLIPVVLVYVVFSCMVIYFSVGVLLSQSGQTERLAKLVALFKKSVTPLTPPVVVPEPVPPKPLPEPQPLPDEKEFKDYSNLEFEYYISYPSKASLVQEFTGSDNFKVTTIAYLGKNQNEQPKSIFNLVDGYIVKVSVFKDIINADLTSLILEKRNVFLIRCPQSADFSNIFDSSIAGKPTKAFIVRNCGADYIEHLLVKDGNVFEITSAFGGDLGYEQLNEATVQNILLSFRFTNLIKPSPKEAWVTFDYKETTYRYSPFTMSFNYPKELDSFCCSLNGPISDATNKIIVLADPQSVREGSGQLFTGFGFFVDYNPAKLNFDDYVTTQKDLLAENYRIVVGKEPKKKDEDFELAGVKGKILKDYAWWGDIYLLPIPNTAHILFISKAEINDGELTQLFDEVLKTVSFSMYVR